MSSDPAPRSLLFCPGSRPDLMAKADRSGADALILDLEDAVAPVAKATARRSVREALARAGPPSAYVRVNHPQTGHTRADLDAIVGARVKGIVLPKADQPEDILHVDRWLAETEIRNGMPHGSLAIVPMIETCLGLHNAYAIAAASARIRGIALASAEEGDLMNDLGGRATPDGAAMAYPRGRLVCEARAAGIGWLIDGVFMNLEDDASLRRECERARSMGYGTKMAIHPRQLAAIHEAFTPTALEIEYATGLLEAFAVREPSAQGALRFRGMMVDAANVKHAQRVLAAAHAARASATGTQADSATVPPDQR